MLWTGPSLFGAIFTFKAAYEAKQVIRRNEVTKEVMPEVWEAVYEQIQQAVQNGWLK